MAFGIAITQGSQVASEANGYIVRFNMKQYNALAITQVQLKSATVFSSPVVGGISSPDLFEYLATTGAIPDLAWSYNGSNLDLFVKTAKFPFNGTVGLGVWWKRNASPVSAVSDTVDVPVEARRLFMSLCRREAYNAKGKQPKIDINADILREQKLLGVING